MDGQKGFTLLEMIITLVVGAAMAAMLVPYLHSNITESTRPILRLQNVFALQAVMENISQDCLAGTTLTAVKAAVGNEGTNQTNSYGIYRVEQNRFIKFVSQNETAATGADPMDTLKITLSHPALPDVKLSSVFTQK